MKAFDFIIVGGGSAGCVVANRLSADPSNRVLLLEAGPADRYPWIHVPIGYFKTIHNPRYDWCYKTDTDPGLNGRALEWPRGKVLGGSSSINGLLYLRGQPEDYDDWAEMGNAGWAWDDVLPYFTQSEDQERGAIDGHGVGGELSVSNIRVRREVCDRFVKAAVEAGIPENDDFNYGGQEGVGDFQLTMKKGRRASTAQAFLKPVRNRKNLTVLTEHQVTGTEMVNGRAVAVTGSNRQGNFRYEVAGELIYSAGAIGSPQLLQLAGIGPAAHLSSLGIDVQIDSPELGHNMQDHLQIRSIYKVNVPTLNTETATWLGQAMIGMQYILTRRGPMALGASQTCAFAKTQPGMSRPDVQFHVQPLSSSEVGHGLDPFPAFTSSVCQLRPTSRGSVMISSPKGEDHPLITPNYLSSNTDCDVAINAVKLSRKIAQSPALAEVITSENEPGDRVQSDAEILDWVRNRATTIYHPTGTCRMGSDDRAVVDPRLKLKGSQNIRVIDASIMPIIVSGNTNAPTIMIAEKGSAMILEDQKAQRAAA